MSDEMPCPPARIMILSGPAGAGKTSIVKKLFSESTVPIEMAVSATTRPPRQNEIHGQDYYFLSPEEFQQRLQNNEFVEWAEVHRSGHFYGTLRTELDRIAQQGKWVLLEIDVEGARNVMRLCPQALSIFLQTPSVDEYERRLRSRGTESEEVIQRRLRTAQDELQYVSCYNHRVINDELDRATREICDLLRTRESELHAE